MAKQKKPNKYDEKVKIDIPDSWGFDDTLKEVVKLNPKNTNNAEGRGNIPLCKP